MLSKASSKCVKIFAGCRLPYFNPLITVIQQQIKAIHNFDDGKFFLSRQAAPHNAVCLFQRPGARARRRAATPRWRSPSPRPPPRPPRPATAPGPRPPLPLLQVSQLLLSIHLYMFMYCFTETQKQKQKLYILHIYFPAVTTWTPPTTRSTPRPRAPPTRRSTTTRTTTTTTTTTTRRVEVATTPQYIHFYERPQLSDLPEQPDFYHVYNNEVGIILIHNLIRFLNFMLILWMDKYTKFSDTVTKSPYLKS